MFVDLTDELEQSDSGMESLTASKDDTPERKPEDGFPALDSIPPGSAQPGAVAPSSFPPGAVPSVPPGFSPPPSGSIASHESGGALLPSGALKEYEDEPDETFSERLWGLTEMFPESVRSGTYTVTANTWSGVKTLYGLSRTVMWVIASSSVILFAPVIFEVERAQVEEMQKSQQKQVLLGTNTALSGPMPNMPPMPR